MLLHQLLEASALANPEQLAIAVDEDSGQRMTYRDVLIASGAIAARLRDHRVKAGDRVVLALPNSREWVSALFGISRVGAIAVPVNPKVGLAACQSTVRRCEPALVIAEIRRGATDRQGVVLVGSHVYASWSEVKGAEPFTEWLSSKSLGSEPAAPVSEDKPALLLFTSGSTAEPRGVLLSHRNVISNARAVAQFLGLTSNERAMVVLPFSYVYGFSVLLTHMLCGATVVVDNRFAFPDVVLDAMMRQGATSLAGVPSTYTILLSRPKFRELDWSHVRYVTQAGGALAPRFLRQLREVLPSSVHIYVMYGQTEAGPRLTYLHPDDLMARLGSVGKPIPGVQIRIVRPDGTVAPARQVGEVVASGPGVMLGYWRDEAATAQALRDGWLYTGDLGWMDEDNYLYIEGRKDFMVKTRGIRANPAQCEEVLLRLNGVREVAVVGMPDTMHGEALWAFIVADGMEKITRPAVLEHCRRHLPAYLVPTEIRFVSDIPKDVSGKVRKHELRAVFTLSHEKEENVGRSA